MRSRITTLFSETPPPQRSPTSVAVSVLVHSAGIAWLYFGLRHTPHLNDQSLVRRFTVRLLKQESLRDPLVKRPVETSPTPTQSAHRSEAQDASAGGQASSPPSASAPLAGIPTRAQTLIQPDVPPDLPLLQQTPVPFVVRWTPVNVPDKVIVLPLPKVLTAADVRASLTAPNREVAPADVKIASTKFSTPLPALPPGTTSPVVVRRPEPVKQVPESASQSFTEPTAAQIISLSDLRLKEGSATIPVANSASRAAVPEPPSPGPSTPANGGSGNAPNKQTGSGSGQTAGVQGNKSLPGTGPVTQNGGDTGATQGSVVGTGSDLSAPVAHITLPKDGQFGVVVVGSSLADQYPEIVNVWGSRIVYTVYLHVGLHKSWILQYSMPRTSDTVAGNATRPEAPWPYDISRPTLAPDDFNSDAVMVHGFVSLAGHFDQLAVIFPTEFKQAKFVLTALQQWKFRAARQNGQFIPVEILLIIPEEGE